MKLFKSFLRKCFTSFWIWVGILFTISDILGNYFEIFKDIPYEKQILIFLIVMCMFFNCYKLYREVALEYPDVLVKYDKNLKFEDCCPLFEVRKLHPKLHNKCKIDIIEDSINSFKVDDYYDECVTLKFFHKICISNLNEVDIKISDPTIKLFSVNDIEDKFFINRLNVSLGKVKFCNERYNEIFEGLYQFDRKIKCEFPYIINKKESGSIFLYIEINLNSLNKEQFDELLNWIRNINLKIKFCITKSKKSVDHSYIIKYNYKRNLIKNMIGEKIKCDEKLERELENFTNQHNSKNK